MGLSFQNREQMVLLAQTFSCNPVQPFCPSVAAATPTSAMDPNLTLESFSKIPFFKDIPQDELMDGYTHFHRQLLKMVETPVDVLQILVATKCCYPRFAKASIQSQSSPVNSVDAERYFSIYNICSYK